ncbi:MAG: comR 2 [Bacteroidetes bacterium]|nr:comR 2 [Bacteroidota bacterium]
MSRQKEFEREEVLEKALEVFWCNGYNGTSFQNLTEGMCINRQSIYDTYGDKHTLFVEVLNHYSEKTSALLREHFAQEKPVKELFRIHFEKAISNIGTDPKSKGCLISNAALEMIPHDAAVKKVAQKSMDDLYHIFLDAVRRGIKNKEITSPQPAEALALHLVNTMQGMNTIGKTISDKKRLLAMMDAALSVLG